MKINNINTLLVMGFIMVSNAHSAEKAFEAKTYVSLDKKSLNYRIHTPKDMETKTQYPLVLLLHGAGERGHDNKKQLVHAATDLLAYSKNLKTPAIIITPQCPSGQQWVNTPWGDLKHSKPAEPSTPMRLVIELLNQSIKTLPVDKTRVYVTGLSMGGYGTWDIIQRHPEIFAAAMPVCGGGDTTLAVKLTEIPIWAFHGGQDKVVPTERSREMIAAIKKSGGKPNYTEYKGVGHNSWSKTYSNQEVLKWLFSQKKSDQ